MMVPLPLQKKLKEKEIFAHTCTHIAPAGSGQKFCERALSSSVWGLE